MVRWVKPYRRPGCWALNLIVSPRAFYLRWRDGVVSLGWVEGHRGNRRRDLSFRVSGPVRG